MANRTELEELEEAVANYGVMPRKIRSEGSLASGLQVFIMTNRFREDQPQYLERSWHWMSQRMIPSVLSRIKLLLRDISGYAYKKAGA